MRPCCPGDTRKNAENARRSKTRAPSSLAVPGVLQDQPEKRRERCAHSRKPLEYIKKKADSGWHRRKRKEYIQKCRERRAPTRTQRVVGKTPRARGAAKRTRGARARALELGHARRAAQDRQEKGRERRAHRRKHYPRGRPPRSETPPPLIFTFACHLLLAS